MLKKNYQIAVFVAVCIALNYGMKCLVTLVSVPMWLDSIGTAFAAYVLGPVCGAIVGAALNIMYGFSDTVTFFYSITSIAMGIVVGICAKKKMFDRLFDTLRAGTYVTFVSTIISAIINCIAYNGYIGNVWGDGIINMLKEWNFNWIIASTIAEFFLEFIDKNLTLLILFCAIAVYRRFFKDKFGKIEGKTVEKTVAMGIMLTLGMMLITPSYDVLAKESDEDNDYSRYIQTVYSSNNGLMSGEANDIASTGNGVMWIGTYAGLYRYSGNNFEYMNHFDSIKNVNCLYVDEEGRLWVGTNDDGLSICIDERIVNTFDEDSGFPSNSVRSVVQQSEGNYYVGTSNSLAVVSLVGGAKVVRTFPEIIYASNLTADREGRVCAVTVEGKVFLINNDGIVDELNDDGEDIFVSCEFGSDGKLYLGTGADKVDVYNVSSNRLIKEKTINTGELKNINCLVQNDSGDIFVCAENGIGWIDKNNKINVINSGSFNSCIDRMTIDFQGNLWFCSTRLGVMKMIKSDLMEVFPEAGIDKQVVNSITKWNGNMYYGTDKGLVVVDDITMEVVDNELSSLIGESRIRCLMVDSHGRLYVCAYGFGLIMVDENGIISTVVAEDTVIGGRIRSCIELSDGTIAASGDQGIVFVKDNKVINTITKNDGLINSFVLCLLEGNDGRIYAGTDGGGIAIIKDGKVVRNIVRNDGLSSGVILRMVKDKDTDNIFVITSNAICYLQSDGKIRELEAFPYSNNYDLYDADDGYIYVTGSAGIIIINKCELIADEVNNYVNLNYRNGLRGSFTANAWNYVDTDGSWYIAGDSGVTRFDIDGYNTHKNLSYRMRITSLKLDGEPYSINNEKVISVPRGIANIEFTPQVINYSSSEPYVCYYMEGIENETKHILLQSELEPIYYTNLKAGEYKFRLAIVDNITQEIVAEQVYTIVKEAEIYDYPWFKAVFFLELTIITIWFTWLFTRTYLAGKLEIQKREIALAKEQIRMGNETILAIAATVDAKDSNTSHHSTRVSDYSVMIAKKLGYSKENIENLRKTALLHDIGKIGIPDNVLNKPARLSDEEYEIMKSHVTRGAEILKDFTLIPNVSQGALYHHERYDGKGYASGLKGKEIPETARIIGLADAFDAMTANRVYRKKLPIDVVLEEIKKGSGTQFDPDIVDIFLGLIEEGAIDIDAIYKEEETNEK